MCEVYILLKLLETWLFIVIISVIKVNIVTFVPYLAREFSLSRVGITAVDKLMIDDTMNGWLACWTRSFLFQLCSHVGRDSREQGQCPVDVPAPY